MDTLERGWSSLFSTSVYSLLALNIFLLLLQCWSYYGFALPIRSRAPLGRDGDRVTQLMDLPPEIRALIWKQIIREERSKPSSLPPRKSKSPPPPSSMLASATNLLTQPFTRAPINSIMSLLCTNQTVRDETLQVACLDGILNFNIDSDQPEDAAHAGTLFRTPKPLLEQVRSAQVSISITPASILPFHNMQALEWRNLAASSQWSRKDAILDQLRSMKRLNRLQLTVIATGNVHANPVWLWHYVCEALLMPLREGKLASVRCSIFFQIEQMPILRPNELVKGTFVARKPVQGELSERGWGFVCRNEHDVFGYDCAAGVREFARGLVAGCDTEGCPYREPVPRT